MILFLPAIYQMLEVLIRTGSPAGTDIPSSSYGFIFRVQRILLEALASIMCHYALLLAVFLARLLSLARRWDAVLLESVHQES